MTIGLVSSLFEETLQASIALAYFIPVVAYVAGSVGAQTSAIAIRAMATMRIHNTTYLLKELVVGLALGIVVGNLGWIGAFVISGSSAIALVVSLCHIYSPRITKPAFSATPRWLKNFFTQSTYLRICFIPKKSFLTDRFITIKQTGFVLRGLYMYCKPDTDGFQGTRERPCSRQWSNRNSRTRRR
ncbi:hypothetical protein BH23PAT2_BH23PAT2_08530 [soil metagenome]